MYWLSRYIERSDGILRMLKINYATSQDSLTGFSWAPVIKIFGGGEEFEVKPETTNREVLQYMVTDKENNRSVINIITRARENARSVQDHITKDLWQCLNEYYHVIKDPAFEKTLLKEDPISVLDILNRQVMLYYGTAELTMPRGEGNSFIRIGKYLERAIQSVDVLDVKYGSLSKNPDLLTDTSYWKHLLLSIGGHELYLKTYRQGIEAENVLEQVVLNNDFPRSVIYSINLLQRHFERIRSDLNADGHRSVSFLIGRLQSRVKYSSVQSIRQEGLHEYLFSIKSELFGIGNALDHHYFAYS